MLCFVSCEQHDMPQIVDGLYSISLDGSNEYTVANSNVGISFSFAGNKIIYDYISSMNLDGTGQQKLVPPNVFSDNNTPTDISVSKDGNKIVFSSIVINAGPNLYIMNSDGSNLSKVNLPDTTSGKSSPSFSFDGSKIVFVTSYGICESNINGKDFKKLLLNPTQKKIKYIEPRFTADNNHIIYGEYNDSTFAFVSLHLFDTITMSDTAFYPITGFL